ncbi:pyridoxamine 5'-phosphate oxidase family protein [Amycolatopsis sp. YIM 10]|uniref:pyridoxamine 5'-phosphate oxidase family protein n=1 Tax=Amycolatopsis sp. YIM 10 TaxID=2653857 RepID=UPI0012905EEE|nr:pyridoxamine 5'-phosphate oxidase family protein [Amycolatopsis sp. YIM 10]QFU88088.1 Pyridoxamine 5'-phosphate oxidase [Amycolatopsis sp. YIM 10]
MTGSWKQFETEAPELAKRVHARFTAEKSHVLATLRRDGSPRVSGSEVEFRDGELVLGSMLDAMKARDLRRDGRCAIHAYPGDPENGGDVKVSGVAEELPGGEDAHLFRVALTDVVLTWVEDNALKVETWWPGRPRVRFERPENGPAIRYEL